MQGESDDQRHRERHLINGGRWSNCESLGKVVQADTRRHGHRRESRRLEAPPVRRHPHPALLQTRGGVGEVGAERGRKPRPWQTRLKEPGGKADHDRTDRIPNDTQDPRPRCAANKSNCNEPTAFCKMSKTRCQKLDGENARGDGVETGLGRHASGPTRPNANPKTIVTVPSRAPRPVLARPRR